MLLRTTHSPHAFTLVIMIPQTKIIIAIEMHNNILILVPSGPFKHTIEPVDMMMRLGMRLGMRNDQMIDSFCGL